MHRVLVDLQFMTGSKGGMETYVREIYSRITEYMPGVEFLGLASSELAQTGAEWFPGELIDSGVSGDNRLIWALSESFRLTRFAKKFGVNIIHSPANFGSWSGKVPSVVTVHDLLSFEKPEYIPGRYGFILRTLLQNSVRAAKLVLTDSVATAHDLEKYLGLSPSRVVVTPLAAMTPSEVDRTMESSEPFLISVGNNLPHKNLEILLTVIQGIPESLRPRLIFTGGNPEPLREKIRSLELDDWVEHRGWVSDKVLENLYANAIALILPTRFEGFGLPVLEAMQRCCPVICSDIPVLREVGGDAALYVDTSSKSAIRQAVEELLNSAERRENLKSMGLLRSQEFSWARTAAETAQVLMGVIDESSSTE